MWRGLTSLPSQLAACLSRLQEISWLGKQQLLLQQETNSLLRELIVKVTTQPAETPAAALMPFRLSASTDAIAPTSASPTTKPHRILTDRDVRRNTRSSLAQDQFNTEAAQRYPHREGEVLPTTPNPPLGLPPVA